MNENIITIPNTLDFSSQSSGEFTEFSPANLLQIPSPS